MAGVKLFTALLLVTVAMSTIATALPSGHKLLDTLTQDTAARLAGHQRVVRQVPKLSINQALSTLAKALLQNTLANDREDLAMMRKLGKRNIAEPATSNALRLGSSDDVTSDSAEEDAGSQYLVNILSNRLREI